MARLAIAEFLGTFFLCFPGIAAILGNRVEVGSGAGLVGIALAHGLGLAIAVHVFGGISGAHVNPAVTCGLLATRRIRPPLAGVYIVAQLAGGTAAAIACQAIFPNEAVLGARLAIPLPAPWVTTPVLLLTEFILTFLLMIAVYGTAVDTRGAGVKIGAFGIGLTVALDILAGGPVTGASMNPARSFGPALVFAYWQLHWAYWIAPIAGGVAAALLYERVLLDPADRGVA
ncbi:MAG: aquaporin [Acidobacteria bacterium]|nr:aquaporin [Acidobacteriota bacterium]